MPFPLYLCKGSESWDFRQPAKPIFTTFQQQIAILVPYSLKGGGCYDATDATMDYDSIFP